MPITPPAPVLREPMTASSRSSEEMGYWPISAIPARTKTMPSEPCGRDSISLPLLRAAAHAPAHLPADHLARLRSDLVRGDLDDDGGDGARVPTGRPGRVHRERDGGRRSHEGLQGNQHPHAVDRDHDRAADDFPADRALAAGDDALEYGPLPHGFDRYGGSP